MEPPKLEEEGQAETFSNRILMQRLNKEINVGDWASSESPGFRILDTAFAVKSPPGLLSRNSE